MKYILIGFIAYLIYDYIRDLRNEKKLAEVKAECIKEVIRNDN